MRRARAAALLLLLASAAPAAEAERPAPLRSGIEFAGPEIRAMQADAFANPGLLWVERGARLWSTPGGAAARSCASCHAEAPRTMKGVATRYPRIDPGSARLLDIEGRVNLCRTRHQGLDPLEHESDELLALSAYVTHQSNGLPLDIRLDWQHQARFERGRALFHRRVGQMNLACVHCHQLNWGKRLLAQTISQGHGNGYPAYRLEWQRLGSLQRRLRACYFGVRAEVPDYDDPRLLDLALYLAWRAQGLPLESPSVRR